MAKRPTKRRAMKIQPAVKTLLFSLPSGAATSTIDLSQCASIVNRRFYRQGINWAVSDIKVVSSATVSGALSVGKLPETWVFSNAWEKGFRAWQKMNQQALAEAESVKPKFLDFKIYADDVHHAAGFGANLLPIDFAGAAYGAGTWDSSKFVIPKTDGTDGVHNREVLAVGASYPPAGASGLGAVSLIEGYAASRALPYTVDPNVPDDAFDADGDNPENWMSALFNEGTTQDDGVLTDMATENNHAPYPYEGDGTAVDTQYPGGENQAPTLQYHDSAFVTATTVGGITHMKGGAFPCGLIRVSSTLTIPEGDSALLQVNLVPGTHRGYLCEPMTEM